MVARWFRIAFAENAFRRFAAAEGTEVDRLRAAGAVALVAGFYRASRAQHARLQDDGDGLLWQWGPDADGRRFEVDLTRQLIRNGDDQPIVQLSLTLAYPWTPARRAAGRGHAWCFSPGELDDWVRGARASAGYRAVSASAPSSVSVTQRQV